MQRSRLLTVVRLHQPRRGPVLITLMPIRHGNGFRLGCDAVPKRLNVIELFLNRSVVKARQRIWYFARRRSKISTRIQEDLSSYVFPVI